MMRLRDRWLPALALLIGLGVPGAALCQESEEPAVQEEAPVDLDAIRADRMVKAYKHQLNSRISRYLGAAAKAMDAGTTEEALLLLDKLSPSRLNPLERALVFRYRAFISYTSGDYEGAIEYFEKVLGEEVLPLDAESKIRFNIAQIHASLQRWPETIAALKRWFRYVEEEEPSAYYLLGIAYYQKGDLERSLENTSKAVDLAPEPREGWLQLLAALYVQKEDYANATPVLEELLMSFPKKQYWVQLSLIYGARDLYRNALAVQQVAYIQGLLVEDKELRRLARSYLYRDLPYPAAAVLEKGIEAGLIEGDADSFELLANSLIASREYDRSLPPLRKAAELAENGNLFARLGQVHLQREEWAEAAEQFQLALEKGGLKNLGSAQLLLGIAYYNDQRVEQARRSFVRASRHEKSKAAATRWLTHIEREAQSG